MTMVLRFVYTACTGFLGSYSLWMYTLLNLDVVGRALDFPQGRVPYLLLGLKGVRLEGVGREWERSWRRGGCRNLDWHFLK